MKKMQDSSTTETKKEKTEILQMIRNVITKDT